MNISGFIAKKKEEFINKKTEQLKVIKERESKLAVANEAYLKEKKEVDKYKAINAKGDAARPNLFNSIVSGLSKISKNKGTKGRLNQTNASVFATNSSSNVFSIDSKNPFSSGSNVKNPFISTEKKRKNPFM